MSFIKIHPNKSQLGLSLVEVIVASFIGLIAIIGMLYLFRVQHKNMVTQTGLSNLRMNGQYTLNEIQYYLAHIGLGLPKSLNSVIIEQGELVIKLNLTRKSAAATMDGASTNTMTIYAIPSTDAVYFDDVGRAVVIMGSLPLEAEIVSIKPKPGNPDFTWVTLNGNKVNFPAKTELYPETRLKLHVCTGIGADTSAGDFKVLPETPRLRAGIKLDSLTLAEGIESLSYAYIKQNGDSVLSLPADLDSLLSIHIKVIARSKFSTPNLPNIGFQKQTLAAKINYRRAI